MARKPVIINPIQAVRVKQLCREQGITQNALAEKIHITPQTLSKIMNGKARLTESVADCIVKSFPEYAKGWLLGYRNEKTGMELWDKILSGRERTQKRWAEWLIQQHDDLVKHIVEPDFDYDSYTEEAILNIFRIRFGIDVSFRTNKPDTAFLTKEDIEYEIEPDIWKDLVLDITRYAEFRMLSLVAAAERERIFNLFDREMEANGQHTAAP